MKKRLLSAALALAMALTLLPMSVFAANIASATDKNPTEVTYMTKVNGVDTPVSFFRANTNAAGVITSYSSVTVTYQEKDDPATDRKAGKWYWLDNKNKDAEGNYTYYAVTSGIVTGTGNSGTWYPDLDTLTKTTTTTDSSGNTINTYSLTSTSLTMLQALTIPDTVLSDSNSRAPTSLTIDVNGFGLTLPAKLPHKFSSLTIQNRKNPLTYGGSVSAITKNTETRTSPAPTGISYSNLTLNISNTTVASIDLKGGSNTVTLNNVTVTGGVTLDGHSATTTTSSGAVSHTYGAQRLNVNNNGVNNLSTKTSFGDAITIANSDGGAVVLNNATGQAAVNVTGNGGSITVNGASDLGAVTVTSRGNVNTATPPSVTINGGSVGAITRGDDNGGGSGKLSTAANTVTVNSAGTAASIETPNGRVTVNQGKVGGTITVKAGALTLTGPVTTGKVTLGESGSTDLTVTNTSTTSGSRIEGIAVAANKGANLHIKSWPTGAAARLNYFGELDLGSYSDRMVSGGTFAKASDTALANTDNATWFSKDLQYVVNMDANTIALYGKTEMARAISDVTSSAAGKAVEMHILCNLSNNTLNLVFGDITWAKIGYNKPIGMILPDMINNQPVSTWTSGDNTASVPAGTEQEIPEPTGGNEFTLKANSTATTIVKSITDAKVSSDTTPVENQNVRVTINGTNIQLSGAVKPNAGTNLATIKLDLTTDALDTIGTTTGTGSGGYLVLRGVQVSYNVDTKAVSFNKLQKLDGGAIVNDLGELVLNNGTGTHYTISAGLAEPAPNLGLYEGGKLITAVVSGSLANRTQTAKDEIIKSIAGDDAEFDINGNRAVLEAINAVQAQYTNKATVTGWVTQAQNYVWTNGNKYVNPTTGQPNGKGHGEEKFGADGKSHLNGHTGSLTVTGTFGADGIAIQTAYAKAYIVPFLEVNATNMNQNGTLNATLTVKYRIDVSADPYNDKEYYTVQTGTLGVLSGDMATKPVLVTFNDLGADYTNSKYIHQDGKYVYEMDGGYQSYKGWAISHAGTGNGSLGTIVLNTVPGPITMETTITNRAPALVDGVSYDTLQAAIDDTVAGLTVHQADGTLDKTMDKIIIDGTYTGDAAITMTGIARTVAVVAKGQQKVSSNTNNVTTTTVNGVDWVVELKSDAVAAGNVALAVQGVEDGTASLSKSTAKAGEKVTVTVLPKEGKTTKGVTIKTNTGETVQATPTTTKNVYEFVVPSNVTSITVSPSFTLASALPFTDVATTANYYNAVKYCYEKNMIQGTTTTTFSPNSTITRAQILTILWRQAGAPTQTPAGLYKDMPGNSDYYNAIIWATYNNIANGYEDGRFYPDRPINRQELATFLYRYQVNFKRGTNAGSVNSLNSFTDGGQVEHWAQPAMRWAVGNGIVSGSGSRLTPKEAAPRWQAATAMYMYCSGVLGIV